MRWVEGPAHSPVLKVAPIDVGGALAEQLWPEHTAILTSATIPVGLGGRVGLDPDGHDELDAGSPFDFESQGLLYCATHLPDPRNDEVPRCVARRARLPDRRRRRPHARAVHVVEVDGIGGRGDARATRRADPRPRRLAQAHAGGRVRARRRPRACSRRWVTGRASTYPAARCRWSRSTGCRSRGPTNRCSRRGAIAPAPPRSASSTCRAPRRCSRRAPVG